MKDGQEKIPEITRDYIDNFLEETGNIVRNIDRNEIEKFTKILFDTWKSGKKVITMGNGGSAATATHFAGDLAKTVANDSSMKDISGTKGFKAICLNDNIPSLTAWINDSGWDKAYSGLLNTFLDEGDTILLVSVHGGSGWSGNLVEAMELAKNRGAKILGLAGFDGGKMKELSDACVVVPMDSTPQVEGFHGVVQHLIVDRLRQLIQSKEEKNDMIFLADTAALDEIEYSFSRGVNDGITTNPKIIESTGDLSIGFEGACKNILEKYPNVPVSLETDLRGIEPKDIHNNPERVRDILLEQADKLIGWQDNVVVKIPICEGGLLATKILSERGIKTNVTACMMPYQALAAAKTGATYVSLFANRILDCNILELSGHSLTEITDNPNWKQIIKENKDEYFEKAWEKTLDEIAFVAKKLDGTGTKLIVGSIRTPEDILRLVQCKPQVITIPTSIVRGLENIENLKSIKRSRNPESVTLGYSLYHPMTQYTLNEFEEAADSYRNKL